MQKNILSEVNRVREIMGLGVILEQQNVGDVVVIDGKRFKLVDLIKSQIPKTNIGQQFASGTFKLSSGSKTKTDELLRKMISFFQIPELKNRTFNIKLEGGASQVPMGDNLANKLGISLSLDKFIGRNEELAKKRAESIKKILEDGLKAAGIENVKVPEPTITVGVTEWEPSKGAKHPDYTKEQFMNVSVEASGVREVLEELPVFCDKPFVPKKGKQASAKNGWRVYPGDGYEIDMGDGAGEITLDFDAYSIPDMFEIIYDGERYRSKNPKTGQEGFVSGRFEKSSVEEIELNKKEREDLLKKIQQQELAIENIGLYGRRVGRGRARQLENFLPIPDRKIPNDPKSIERGEQETYSLSVNYEVDMIYLNEFFEMFPTMKDFLAFSGDEDRPRKFRRSIEMSRKDVRELYERLVGIRKSINGKINSAKKRIGNYDSKLETINSELEYNEIYGGNMNAYLKGKKRELEEKGFDESIIGDNGSITFTKKPDVNLMYLQVYAPLGGTVWNAKVSCKPVDMMASK